MKEFPVGLELLFYCSEFECMIVSNLNLLILTLTLSLSSTGFSQEDYFSKRLLKGKWTISYLAFESVEDKNGRSLGDTIVLSKKQRGLDGRLDWPYKFKKNKKVKRLTIAPYSCASMPKFESIWALSWRYKGQWATTIQGEEVYLSFDNLTLKHISAQSDKLFFVICK
jgi:hypothetical protein